MAGHIMAGHILAGTEVVGAGPAWEPGAARTLTVIGSYSGLARQQVQALVNAGVHHVRLDPAKPADPAVHGAVLDALADSDVVLTPDPAGAVDKSQAQVVAQALALAAAAGAGSCDALVLTGGETATAVLETLGVASFTVLGEIEAGVVVSRLPGSLPLMVTKAGAFGDAGTLVRTTLFLKNTTTETSSK
jgi:uncharacterized protein YgbK (DUF1537 family)